MRLAWSSTRPWDLAAVAAITLLTSFVALLDAPSWLRIPLGLAFVLFAPGYSFVAALFPERHRESSVPIGEDSEGASELRRGLSGLERVALSLGLSIAIVPLLGLALNYTPWGIGLVPVLLLVSVFTLACLGIAWRRRLLLPEGDRLTLQVSYEGAAWGSRTLVDRALSVALVLAVVFAAGSLLYVLATPRTSESFTEFYILGPGGKASCYPTQFRNGEYRLPSGEQNLACPLDARNVTLGIVNHEGRDVTYHLRTLWTQETRLADNTTRVDRVWEVGRTTITLPSIPVDLSLNATFKPQHEARVLLPAPPTTGTLRLSFQLYLDPPAAATPDAALLDSPYRRLHIWIDSIPGA